MGVRKYPISSIIEIMGLTLASTSLYALEENMRYCGKYTYDFVYQGFEDVIDATIIRGTDSFVAYNSDGMGVGFSRNSSRIYMFFGFQEDYPNFNTASPLDNEEVCPILEEILLENRFQN